MNFVPTRRLELSTFELTIPPIWLVSAKTYEFQSAVAQVGFLARRRKKRVLKVGALPVRPFSNRAGVASSVSRAYIHCAAHILRACNEI